MRRYYPDHSSCCKNYNPKFVIGDKVVYSQRFLESIAETPCGPLCHAKGVVTSIRTCGTLLIVEVDWKDPSIPKSVNAVNLAKPGSIYSMSH